MYDTPDDLCGAVVRRLLERGALAPEGSRVLEPSVGAGAWVRAVQAHALADLHVCDVDPLAPGLALPGVHVEDQPDALVAERWSREAARRRVREEDLPAVVAGFLTVGLSERPDLVLGNPPYSITTNERTVSVLDLHIARALEVARRHVVFVLRAGALFGSRSRFRDLWSGGNLREVWTVVGRPKFAHNRTDPSDTCVLWFDLDHRGPYLGDWLEWGKDA